MIMRIFNGVMFLVVAFLAGNAVDQGEYGTATTQALISLLWLGLLLKDEY